MKRILVLAFAGLVAPAIASAQGPEMSYGQSVYNDTSPPLSEMAASAAPATGGPNREIPLRVKPDMGGQNPDAAAADGGLQAPSWFLGPTPAPIISEPGLSEQDNVDLGLGAVVPPDTNGDIGLDDDGNRIYIQYINSIWGVFDVTGNLIAGPFVGNTFWTGFGGFCESNNNGDPIVLYDENDGRWMFSQFSVNQGIQCVAVSATADPLGPYYRYAFNVTPGGANDYPKMGVWDDSTADADGGQSAYTFTMRDFGGAGGAFSVGAGVMERDQMLLGNPAQFIKFSNPCGAGDCIEGQLPPHQAGPTPPANTCPTYWTAVDAAFDESPHANDGYRNHTLCVDWSSLASSTYAEGTFVVAGSNFDRFVPNISPILGGDPLDAIPNFTMYRAQYRWFGDNARVVLNTTVDAGDDRAGIRWAETRSADGDSAWFLQQDGTYAPDDGLERWMGSIAQDQAGNIALGYSATGENLFPAVRYTSRMGGDALGTLPGGEVSCVEGGGAQVASAGRWGDYSSMSVDPTDDCTFWYTQEYYETTGSFDFNTRICSFKFADCGSVCEPTEPVEETCNDSRDNDCDGDFDCGDSDCADDVACGCVPDQLGEICSDGVDNDCNGLIDCDDSACDAFPACLPPPENDLCTDAIPLECDTTVSGTTVQATFDDVGSCGTDNTAPGVWYSVNADGALITASTCNAANFDTKLSAFDGECGDLGCIGGNDDTAGCGLTTELSWGSTGGDQLILVHGFGGATGNFDLTVTCEEPPEPPENDLCSDAIPLECGDTVSGTTELATFDDAGFCGTDNTAPGVWYSVSHFGVITASTCNQADFDTKLSAYSGECGDLGCIDGNDDGSGCAGFTSELSWASGGDEELLLVHGFGEATGNFDLTLTCADFADGDFCEDAQGPLAVDTVTAGTTTDATVDEPPDIDCGTTVTAPGTWYTVVGTGNTMTASTCNDGDPSTGGADYDTKVSVYCADCETKECIGGQDDAPGCDGFSTQFSWPTNPGQTYNVLVHGFGSGTGDFDLAILDDGEPTPPSNDCDGVPGSVDFCPGTVLPESVPTNGFHSNGSALTGFGGIFETAPPNPQGVVYTIEDTAGCSCEQIVDILDLGQGHLKHGCSFSAMDDWLAFTGTLCQDCLIANGTPGCQNGDCEAAVCAVDPFCCDVLWDGICASEADDICAGDLCEPVPVETQPCGDCLISNGTPGCQNGDCQAAVCAVDPFCCDVFWDDFCAGEADTICVPDLCDPEFATVAGGRAHTPVVEPISKDPNYRPKE